MNLFESLQDNSAKERSLTFAASERRKMIWRVEENKITTLHFKPVFTYYLFYIVHKIISPSTQPVQFSHHFSHHFLLPLLSTLSTINFSLLLTYSGLFPSLHILFLLPLSIKINGPKSCTWIIAHYRKR